MLFAHKPVRRRVEIPGHGIYTVEVCAAGIRYRAYRSPKWLLLPHGVGLVRAATLETAPAKRPRKGRRRRPRKLGVGV